MAQLTTWKDTRCAREEKVSELTIDLRKCMCLLNNFPIIEYNKVGSINTTMYWETAARFIK